MSILKSNDASIRRAIVEQDLLNLGFWWSSTRGSKEYEQDVYYKYLDTDPYISYRHTLVAFKKSRENSYSRVCIDGITLETLMDLISYLREYS